MYKPSDIFLSIVDIFAIIVPGGVLTYFLYYTYSADIEKIIRLTEVQYWVAFFFFAYFFGHIISFVGERMDKARSINRYIERKFEPLWRRVEAIKNELHPKGEQEVINIYQWCRSVLIATSPDAMADINRLVAATDFFRNLYILFPVVGIISLLNQHIVFGIVLMVLTLPCMYISALGRLDLLKRSSQHVIVFYRLGKLEKAKEN